MKSIRIFTIIIAILFIPFISNASRRYSPKKVEQRHVVIGIKVAPPFIEKANAGYRGLSIDSWDLVNKDLDWSYEFKVYPSLEALLNAVKNKEVDFSINPITVTAERYKNFSFSQPYFISNTMMARKAESAIWNVIVNVISWQFISAVGALALIIFIFGFLVWIFERKKNKEQFGIGRWKGLGEGFWWSAVTMTTVGYGDKAPVTFMGRIIGIIWMFFAVITISSLTAGIASALTVQNLKGEITSVDELEKYKVETIEHSSSAELLQAARINYKPVLSVKEGLEDLYNDKTEVFIYDGPLIKYEIRNLDLDKKIVLLPTVLRKDYLSYCFPKDSKLLKDVNPVLISSLKTLEWNAVVNKFEP